MRLAASLSIAPAVSEALASLGIVTDTDLLFGPPPHELLARLPPGTITLRQLQGAIESISAASSSQGLSVDDLLSSSAAIQQKGGAASSSHASTGLPDLDTMLGNGGFVEGRVYEISGDKRTGKTCLALNTVIHHLVRYDTCHACWVDTTGDFTVEKALQVLGAATDDPYSTALDRFEVSLAFDVSTMFDVLQTLRMSSSYRQVRFLVVDTIWALLSPLFSNFSAQGHAIMTDLMHQLRQCAQDLNLTVLVLNNSSSLTPRDGPKAPNLSACEAATRRPALGPSFQFMTDATLWLSQAEVLTVAKAEGEKDSEMRDADGAEAPEPSQDAPRQFICEILRSRLSPTGPWCTITIQNYIVKPCWFPGTSHPHLILSQL
ncbi:P-loop containing nucleoside triphosphate hydrolase protein [Schizophyllum commune H4-8]|uniref:P-loop containing nucleoside triphosphate hydrolase protein n=1 Tax=Schizophyllum commune (strain H4-8 / FGSC 9210) TaxID=578458 RepID=UPI00215E5607|nr:P-loop containing nucleoside triphosphate hydrolase protein [Schizophyllum commune H4-8]KAI5892443.1 P-loop containing nucleoside triphosphate hydrolase protein [Schizophyllum commune H4-8]